MRRKAPESSALGYVLRLQDDIEGKQTSKHRRSMSICKRLAKGILVVPNILQQMRKESSMKMGE